MQKFSVTARKRQKWAQSPSCLVNLSLASGLRQVSDDYYQEAYPSSCCLSHSLTGFKHLMSDVPCSSVCSCQQSLWLQPSWLYLCHPREGKAHPLRALELDT